MPAWPRSNRPTRWMARHGGPPSSPRRRAHRRHPRQEHDVAIFLNADSRVLIQGITGSEGSKHGRRMLATGTTVVGGTNPRKAGQSVDLGGAAVPVFATVGDAM